MATAILIDGDFFIRRCRFLVGKQPALKAAADLHRMCREHLKQPERKRVLYRIFFYDCPPLTKKVHNPITKQAVDFSKTRTATWRTAFHDELRKLRKVALRLGYLNERMGHWSIRPDKLKELLNGAITVKDLTEQDVLYLGPAERGGHAHRSGHRLARLQEASGSNHSHRRRQRLRSRRQVGPS